MNNTANKKDIFYIVVLILTFITVVIGATFAIYTAVYEEKEKVKAVYTGTYSIEYKRGDIIKSNYLSPTENPTLETEDNVYKNEFTVNNTGSIDSKIEIYIDYATNFFDYRREDIEDDNNNAKYIGLRYLLYNTETKEVVKEGEISGIGTKIEIVTSVEEGEEIVEPVNKTVKILDRTNLEIGESVTYTLIIWIPEIIDVDQNDQQKKTLKGQIRVEANQKWNNK